MMASVKVGVSVFLTEDGRVGIKSTTQNELTALGLLVKGILLAAGVVPEQKEESNIVVPRME